ncbi:MAG: hypothetical protein CVU57_24405 [Deltaproteobacteria bacterium HGW-Deltaproteobacteria-15]|nr:MAG: hypothetical protein CVU57_24405 [Deltaproteobacteria bacterium HGW-Deltaproteobacteria-15]
MSPVTDLLFPVKQAMLKELFHIFCQSQGQPNLGGERIVASTQINDQKIHVRILGEPLVLAREPKRTTLLAPRSQAGACSRVMAWRLGS